MQVGSGLAVAGGVVSNPTPGLPSPLGSAGQVVGSDGAEAAWLTPLAQPGFVDPTRADGDLLYRKKTANTALSVIHIGDSITSNFAIPATCATDLSIDGLTLTAINKGVSGTSTSDWAPGSANDAAAVAVFTAGMGVSIMLGTNDARVAVRNSAATYASQLFAIVAAWIGRGSAAVWLHFPPYAVPGSNSGDQDATANTLRVAYQAVIKRIVNGVTVLLGDTTAYAYFAANPSQLSDGIHPGTSGQAWLAQAWASGMQAGISAILHTTTLQRLTLGTNLSIIPASGGTPASLNAAGGGAGGDTYGPIYDSTGAIIRRADGRALLGDYNY